MNDLIEALDAAIKRARAHTKQEARMTDTANEPQTAGPHLYTPYVITQTTQQTRWIKVDDLRPGHMVNDFDQSFIVHAMEEHLLGKTGVVVWKIWLRDRRRTGGPDVNSAKYPHSLGRHIVRMGHEMMELTTAKAAPPKWWSPAMGLRTRLVTP